MGTRPSLGIGVGLHRDKFPVWPDGIKMFPIPEPGLDEINPGPELFETWPLDAAAKLGGAEGTRLIARYRAEYFGIDDEENVIGSVFRWPDAEYAIPDWLILPISTREASGHLALYGLAAIEKSFRGAGGFVPLPTYPVEDAFSGIYYYLWDEWVKAGKPDPAKMPWRDKLPYISLVEWCVVNDQCYDTLQDDARMWTSTFQYIMRKAGVEIAISDLRLGVYMEWS